MAKLLNQNVLSKVQEKLKKEQEEMKNGWGDKFISFKAGNDYRVRLLALEEEEGKVRFGTPYIDSYVHVFKDESTEKFSIVTCPTTFEPMSGFKKCPICTHAKPLYDSKNPEDKELYDTYKRRYNGYMPVYVIEDTCTPENVGKIKIMRYGLDIDKFLKLKIWGIKKEEKGKKEEETDKKPSISSRKISPLENSAFNFGEGYDLCISVGKKVDPKSKKEFNNYICEFDMQNKYELSTDATFNMKDVEDQLSKFDFFNVVPNCKKADLDEFFNRYVLGKEPSETNTETEETPEPTKINTIKKSSPIKVEPVEEKQDAPVVEKAKPTVVPSKPPVEEVSKDELEDLLSGL